MKTIKKLKQENETLRKEVLECKFSNAHVERKKLVRKNKAGILLNNKCIQALQSGISEENFVKQLDEVTAKLKLIEGKFEEWKENTPRQSWGKNPESTYKRLNKIAVLRGQVKFLNYLLYE